LGIDRARIGYLGLNHLSWITSIVLDGKDRLKEALEEGLAGHGPKNIPDAGFDPECLRVAGGIPCAYLHYYYHRERRLAEKPALLSERGGSLYSEAAVSLIASREQGERDTHVVNIRNRGALDFMEDDDVVEIPAAVGSVAATAAPRRISCSATSKAAACGWRRGDRATMSASKVAWTSSRDDCPGRSRLSSSLRESGLGT
jgi:6-phospho-beta-glucosidase